MSQADELFEKIRKMKLSDLLLLCGNAVETNLDEKRLDVIFQILEMRLQKRRMCNKLGIKDDDTIG